jgi:DNA-binding YbaB/EbfC family protein
MMPGMKKAQQMLEKFQTELAALEVEAKSGGDLVRVVATGDQKIKSITLDPALKEEDMETIADLVMVAINNALDEVKTVGMKKMQGMGLPGLF